MASDFFERFEALLARPGSTFAEWRELAQDLGPDHFARVVTYTKQSNPAADLALARAITTFVVARSGFRDFLGEYASDPAQLALHPPSGGRIVLRALVEAVKADPGSAAPAVFIGLAAHRTYNDAPSPTGTLGEEIRACLTRQLALLLAAAPATFLPPFSFALTRTRRPLQPFSATFDDLVFLQSMVGALIDPATIDAIVLSDDTLVEGQLSTLLADTLHFAHFESFDASGHALHDAIGRAILDVVERSARLWSDAYAGWDARPSMSRVDPARCWRVESHLRALLDRLGRSPRPGMQAEGFFDNQAVTAYQRWITLCGGFPEVRDASGALSAAPPGGDTGAPLPLFLRDWPAAVRESEPASLDLVQAIAVRQHVRRARPLVDPSTGGSYLERSTSVAAVRQVGEESVLAAVAQRLLAPIDLERGDLLAPLPAAVPAPQAALFQKKTVRRQDTAAPLHPDHRRAIRIAAAAALQWRAEIAYRTAGPRAIAGGFSPQGQREVERARLLYRTALDLVGGEADDPEDRFLVGAGLLGHALEEQRKSTRDECRLRLRQIDRGDDWAADGGQWPIRFIWDLNADIQRLLDHAASLEGAAVDLAVTQRDLEQDQRQAELAVRQAEQLLQAARDFAEAESCAKQGLLAERGAAVVRLQIAEHRHQEARYLAAARRFAVAAADETAQALAALEKVEEETERQLQGQLELLREQITRMREKLRELAPEIQRARDELPLVADEARRRFREKQSQSALFSILKKVGSLVSIYFTGVDLVTIAETALQAVKSAQSGDWAGAVQHAIHAGDLATGGAISDALDRGVVAAERLIGNVMADSLDTAARTLEGALDIGRTEAMTAAIQAVSRQAFRMGVSLVAQKAGVEALPAVLGIPEPEPQVLARLRDAAEEELLGAAFRAFQKQGPQVTEALGRVLGGAGSVEQALRKGIRQAIAEGRRAEAFIVEKIDEVQQQLAQDPRAAKILAELKGEMLAARDEVAGRIGGLLGVETGAARVALERLAAQVIDAASPGAVPSPPVVLPTEVARSIQSLRRSVERARGKIGFFTQPGYAERAANQLSDIGDEDRFEEQLGQLTSQLSQGISDAQGAMGDAESELAGLLATLGETQVEAYKQRFVTEAAEWREKAQEHVAEQERQLLLAAGESALAAASQIEVERFGAAVVESRLAALEARMSGYAKQADAAETELHIREIALARSRQRRDRFLQLTGAPNADLQKDAADARLHYLDRANRLLVQTWQLFTLYEADPLGLPTIAGAPRFAPTFLTPTRDGVAAGLTMLKAAQEEWNGKLLETFRPLTSIRLEDVLEKLNTQDRERIAPLVPNFGETTFEGLVLTDVPDSTQESLIARLRRGLSFRIGPTIDADRPPPAGYPAAAPVAVYTKGSESDGTRGGVCFGTSTLVVSCDDTFLEVFNVRLLGISLKYLREWGGLKKDRALALRLRQESDCGIVVRAAGGGRRYVPLPLPPLLGARSIPDDPATANAAGAFLAPGALNSGQWETRPLFGTYTIRLLNPIADFTDPASFRLEIHFIAVGRPG